jgi:hypothetical protein
MTLSNLKIVNAQGGIQADRQDGVSIYFAPGGHEHEAALSGIWGPVAPYVAPEEPSAAEVLAREKLAARAQVVAMIDAREMQITGPVPANERASWGTKADAARAWLANQTAPVPALIATEAALAGETALAVATRIVAKADAWEPVTAAHTARRRLAEAAIAAATDSAGVAAALTDLAAAINA